MKQILLWVVCITLVLAAQARGQHVWEQANGPIVGVAKCFSFDSTGRIFVGTDYGVFISPDRGNSWKQIFVGLGGLADGSRIWSSPNGKRVYVVNFGLYQSSDGGNTWAWADSTSPRFASGPFGEMIKGSILGLFISKDSGATWKMIDSNSAYGVAITRNGRIFESFGNFDTLKTKSSIDGGQTWTQPNSFYGYSYISNTGGLIASPQGEVFQDISVQDGYASRTSSFHVFDSAGSTSRWVNAPMSSYMLSDWTNSWTIGPNGDIYVIQPIYYSYNTGIYRSSNSGYSWQVIDSSANGPIAASHDGLLLARMSSDSIAKLEVGVSTDRGGTWCSIQNGLLDLSAWSGVVTRNNALLVSTENGLFRSTSAGNNWRATDGERLYDLYRSSSGRIFGGPTNGGIWISNDDGVHWQPVDSTQQFNIASRFCDCGKDCIIVPCYFYEDGKYPSAILRSTDNGEHWLLNRSDSAKSFSSVRNGSIIFKSGNGLSKSTDHGLSWQTVSDTSNVVYSIIDLPDGSLIGSNHTKVMRSLDDGETWTQVGTPLKGTWLSHFVKNSKNEVFAASDSGIFKSADSGLIWQSFGTSLTLRSITDILCDSSDRVYVLSLDSGVFRSTLSANKVEQITFKHITVSVSPNPILSFTSSATLHFILPKSEYITLTLYDISGREVRRIWGGEMGAGEHDVPFERGSLPAGVYFYRLATPDGATTRAMVIE